MSPSPGRSVALDLLRAAAIILVLGRHMPGGQSDIRWLDGLFRVWHQGGWIGVDLFFVLSGYLVSGLLFKEHKRTGRIDLKTFYIRRGFRIYPPFIALLVFTVAMRMARGRPIPGESLLAEIFFFQNYRPGLWFHTWSLAVEEHFYLLLPLFVLLLWRRQNASGNPFKILPYCFVALALICLAARIFTAQSGPFSIERTTFPTHLRLDSLFFGTTLSYFSIYFPEQFQNFIQRRRTTLILSGLVLLCPPFIWDIEQARWIVTFGFALLFIGSGCVLMGMEGAKIRSNGWMIRFFSGIGRHSYSIYLWHFAVVNFLIILGGANLRGQKFLLWMMLYVAGSLLVGWALSALLESPILKFRDRLFPSRSKPLESA